jgi:hypothetical protein
MPLSVSAAFRFGEKLILPHSVSAPFRFGPFPFMAFYFMPLSGLINT